jgi:hypothetical protein
MKVRTFTCWVDEVDNDTIYARTSKFSFELNKSSVKEEDREFVKEGAGFYIVVKNSNIIIKFMKPFSISPTELLIVKKKSRLLYKSLMSCKRHC